MKPGIKKKSNSTIFFSVFKNPSFYPRPSLAIQGRSK
jgi:hypothetical protein